MIGLSSSCNSFFSLTFMITPMVFLFVSGFLHSNHQKKNLHPGVTRIRDSSQSVGPFYATFPNDKYNNVQSLVDEWGITKQNSVMEFPETIEQVIDTAFDAIAGTIYNRCAMDPNVASNARSTSIFTYRPVRQKFDSGRIGVEMDGVEFLFPEEMTPPRAIRRAALMLAGKMSSNESWKYFENNSNTTETEIGSRRPVVVHFNSVKEALWASRELQELRKLDFGGSTYENVRIQCLSDAVPVDMRLDRNHRRRYGGLSSGFVNATRGLYIIVQPTDYNKEHKPPGPAVESINHFQRIIAQASVEELPVIALSPRFLSNENPFQVGFDQSGYQKAAMYGGQSPPIGPTPWIMRDFTPPIYSWIGNALTVGKVPKDDSKITRIVLSQSVMEEDHLWNVYFAKESACQGLKKATTDYIYLASSSSQAGRPTSDLMRRLLEEYVG